MRRLPDGTIEFLGRLDHQVKIHGHRIELGEIEAALERHPDVKQCVLIASEGVHGDRRLVAYFVPAAGSAVSTDELRHLLSETLPAYMIPAAFVSLSSFPLTPSGKLDRKALPSPDVSTQESDVAPLAPRTPTEETLARIWREMLKLKQVGLRDNFFEVGGYSLLATRVVGEINKTLKVHLNIPTFFRNPTIEQPRELFEQQHYVRPKPQVVQLQSGRIGLPLYFIGTALPEYRVAQLIGEDREIFALDVPLPEEWSNAIAAGDRAALPTFEQLGRAVRRYATCACPIVTLRGGGMLRRRQDSIRNSARAAACRGQGRAGSSH